MTVMVSPAWTIVGALTSVSRVDGMTTATLPAWCSLVAGTAWDRRSVPLPSAVQLKSLAGAVKEQVKLTDAFGASVPLNPADGTQLPAHAPVPSTWTPVMVPSPVFFSLTMIVTESPAWTWAGAFWTIDRTVAGCRTS